MCTSGIWGQAKEVAIAKCNKETYVTFAFSLAKLELRSALGMNISQRITGQKNKNKTNKQAHTGLTSRILNDRIQTMKEINYKNKKLKVPYDLTAGEMSTELVTRQNPFSGQSIELPEFAAVIYDKTIELNLKAERKDAATGQPPGISKHQDDWQLVRNGINFFRQYFAKEYMVLLD